MRAALEGNALELSALAYYDNNLHPDASEREAAHAHLRACIDAAAALGGVPVGTFIGRDPARSVADNLREAERIFPPLVDYAGERGVRLMIENCVMEGWHPDGYPGNLAYSPELWEWMFGLGLYLNFDPSHLLWLGIDPVAALTAVRRPGRARAREGRGDVPAGATATGSSARPSTREEDPWDMGWWRYPIPASARWTWPRYVDALYEGGFDGVLSVEHEDPVWGGTAREGRGGPRASPTGTSAGWWSRDHGPRGARPRQGVPGRRRSRASTSTCRRRGALPARPERGRQVDAHQVHLRCRSSRPSGEILFDGRAAAGRRSRRVARARRRDDLPGARPRRGPDGGREHVPRSRAAPRAAARPRPDAPGLDRAARAARPRRASRPATKVGRCGRPPSRSSRSPARSRATSAC